MTQREIQIYPDKVQHNVFDDDAATCCNFTLLDPDQGLGCPEL